MNEPQFEPLTVSKLIEILGLTIKKDEENKLITFLCQLSAYTENAQFNISFNAPSSTGKSFIPLEIATLFPKEDLIKLGNASPTAFFHEKGKEDKEKNTITVDLERKIIIFLDQPKTLMLERLRSLLSHDQKEMESKITDKNKGGGNRTKTVIIRGYPSVIFCSAGLKIDEQEATRFFLLSPEVSQEKMREAILQKIKKESDNGKFRAWLDEIPERKLLEQRILAIKKANIDEIKISNHEKIEEKFLKNNKMVKPRHQRDVGRLISLVKSLALLNWQWRNPEGSTITANVEDIEEAFRIWDKISVSQDLNLPPYIYKVFQEVIMPLWDGKSISAVTDEKEGITRANISQRYFEVYGRMIDNEQLRQQILPMLETAGLITQERDPTDQRKTLVYPSVPVRGDTSGKVQVPDFMIDGPQSGEVSESIENLPVDQINGNNGGLT